jgi:hypothetical protein
MAKSSSSSIGAAVSSRRDSDGNPIYNEILLVLPRAESEAVLPKLKFVRLKLHQVFTKPARR